MSTTVQEAREFKAAAILPQAAKKITAINSPTKPFGR